MTITSTNPSQGYKKIGTVESSTPDQVQQAVVEARSAQAGWAALSQKQRNAQLQSFIDLVKQEQEPLALLASQEMGMPITETREDIDYSIGYFEWYLEHATEHLVPEITYQDDKELHTVVKEPIGVAAIIIAWNFAMSNFVWKTGQHLVAGNAVVVKHSEEVALFGKKLEELFAESEVLDGVVQFVHGAGDVGQTLVEQDVDMICFKGSTGVGKQLYKVAAEKFIPAVMELGGSAPGVVFADADLDTVIESTIFNRFANCGQICDGLKRLIVHESRYDQVVAKLIEAVAKLKIGDATDDSTQIGPLVAERQLLALEEQVADAIKKGAKVEVGGQRPPKLDGAYYQPTILTNISTEMKVWKEEVFGPVLPVVSFSSYDEAIKLANDTEYGLGGYIFTQDAELFQKAAAAIKTGMIAQNGVSYVRECNPFGGTKESGLGRENGKYGFEDVTQIKIISQQK